MAPRAIRSDRSRRLFTRSVILVALLTIAAPAAASKYDFGSVVQKSDYDYTPFAKSKDVRVCWVDDDGSGTYNLGEPLYLLLGTACGPVQGKDIRLLPAAGQAGGTEVKADHADFQLPTSGPLAHAVVYSDLDGDGEPSGDDLFALAIMNAASGVLGPGDLRLNGWSDHAAGSLVRNGDSDVGWRMVPIAAAPDGLSTPEAFYKAGSTYYLNVDLDEVGVKDLGVEDDDVRLLKKAPDPFARLESADAVDVPAMGAPELALVEVSFTPHAPFAGSWVRIVATIENSGSLTGAGLFEVGLDDEVVDARGTPTLAPGERATLVATLPVPHEVGIYRVTVLGEVHELTVETAPSEMLSTTSLKTFVVEDGEAVPVVSDEMTEDPAPAPATHDPASAAASPTGEPVASNDAPGLGALAVLLLAGLVAHVVARRD